MARTNRRSVSGILLLDKPSGMTSNAALQKVKWLYKARKAGHTGSLDPLATGLLPICFGEATKISGFLLDADKRYRVTVALGATTTTGDSEGEVLEQLPVPEFDRTRIEAVLGEFHGDIEQIPPMYSALKHKGERLYKLARKGVEVERPPRPVTIYELRLVEFTATTLELDVRCSKGTYVRTLAEDIGRALGTGAHVSFLRRTGLGPFDAERMISLETLLDWAEHAPERMDEALLPIDAGLRQWPEVTLTPDVAYYVRQGQPVWVPHAPSEGWVRVYDAERGFLGMGVVLEDGRIGPKRLLAQN